MTDPAPHYSPEGAIQRIRLLAERLPTGEATVMEVCGTHTVAIARAGLRSILPENIRLVSGPGCPVCVTSGGYVDAAIKLAATRGVHVATYGDMLRVPGTAGSLADERARGAELTVVYSTLAALRLARSRGDREVVFLGVGFETTAPATAAALKEARREGVGNFSVYAAHKLMIPAMAAILDSDDLAVDGLLAPGHVSVVIGSEAYRGLAAEYGRPFVVAGFEPSEILTALEALLACLVEGKGGVVNAYPKVVSPEGNVRARELMFEVFEPSDAVWRGLGTIPGSGLAFREEWGEFDAVGRFEVAESPDPGDRRGCRCGDVIRGALDPRECPQFGKACTPAHPLGPCMVSREGSCQAHFRYR
jgi:hydrogenase expression/formation protein HypD